MGRGGVGGGSGYHGAQEDFVWMAIQGHADW